jgi:hypothetical protein
MMINPLFTDLVAEELSEARRKHPLVFHSKHEGLAIIEEEFLEFRHEVFHGKDRTRLRLELVQLAAMCQRFAEDNDLLSIL